MTKNLLEVLLGREFELEEENLLIICLKEKAKKKVDKGKEKEIDILEKNTKTTSKLPFDPCLECCMNKELTLD